jgi:hypothetical protein
VKIIKTTLSICKHLSAIKELTKLSIDNFNLLASQKEKGQKCKILHKEEILKNGVLLVVLRDKEAEDVISFSEKNEDEMSVVIKKEIQEFKNTRMMY